MIDTTKNAHIQRHLDLIDTKILDVPVTIIGAGSLGSFAALALAKLGWPHLTVIDFDNVSIENMSCQFHRHSDIGLNKAEALAGIIQEFTGGLTTVNAKNEMWKGETFPGVVVMAVDNLNVRKLIWEAHQDSFSTKFIIDARMGAEVASLYVMNPHDREDRASYPKSLTTDEEAEQAPCTAKSTTYTALMLGGLMAQATKECLSSPHYIRTMEWNLKEYRSIGFRKGSTRPTHMT